MSDQGADERPAHVAARTASGAHVRQASGVHASARADRYPEGAGRARPYDPADDHRGRVPPPRARRPSLPLRWRHPSDGTPLPRPSSPRRRIEYSRGVERGSSRAGRYCRRGPDCVPRPTTGVAVRLRLHDDANHRLRPRPPQARRIGWVAARRRRRPDAFLDDRQAYAHARHTRHPRVRHQPAHPASASASTETSSRPSPCCGSLPARRWAPPPGEPRRREPSQRQSRRDTSAVADYANTHNPKLISADGRTTWALINMPNPDLPLGQGVIDRIPPVAAGRGAAGGERCRDGLRAAAVRWRRRRAEHVRRDPDRDGRRAGDPRPRVRFCARRGAGADGDPVDPDELPPGRRRSRS